MSVTITRVTNGYYIVDSDGGADIVIEKEASEAEAARRMLWEVNEIVGHPGSRYDKERVRITLEPGDKWLDTQEALT